jgi:hypothetical protein
MFISVKFSADSVKNRGFGKEISISSDGNVALIGANGENSYTGAAYICRNVEDEWTPPARLSCNVAGSEFGRSISISSDGNVALIGAYGENSYTGAAYIYQNVSGTWTQMARITSNAAGSWFGYRVSLSADGTTALIGAENENSGTGAAYIYSNVAGTWTQTARLASGATGGWFGSNVSLSADGTVAVIGAPGENSYVGAAYIYRNIEGTWTQTARMESGVASSWFGLSISVNSDGSVALIGANGENGGNGAAYIYQNVAGTWTQIARLATDVKESWFGTRVALSSDGSVAILGVFREKAAYVYKNIAGCWILKNRLFSSAENSRFGLGVALSSDGSSALIGDFGEGAVYLYRDFC